jgi:hypothetical protein
MPLRAEDYTFYHGFKDFPSIGDTLMDRGRAYIVVCSIPPMHKDEVGQYWIEPIDAETDMLFESVERIAYR